MNNELVTKIQEAVRDMYTRVKFDPEEHRYTRITDGKFMAGISSVSDMLPKPFLMPWAAKMVTEWIRENAPFENGLYSLKEEDLDTAKGAYRRKSEEALDLGTEGHAHLEQLVKSRIRHEDAPKLNDSTLTRPITQFLNWEALEIDYWILSEARVCDTELEIAGTLDAMAMTKSGKLSVIDFKFANHVSPSYYLQTAGYSLAFEKYGIEVQDRIIVRLPKTLTMKRFDKETRTYSAVENNIEIARSPFDYGFDKQTFLNARSLYKYVNSFENK